MSSAFRAFLPALISIKIYGSLRRASFRNFSLLAGVRSNPRLLQPESEPPLPRRTVSPAVRCGGKRNFIRCQGVLISHRLPQSNTGGVHIGCSPAVNLVLLACHIVVELRRVWPSIPLWIAPEAAKNDKPLATRGRPPARPSKPNQTQNPCGSVQLKAVGRVESVI